MSHQRIRLAPTPVDLALTEIAACVEDLRRMVEALAGDHNEPARSALLEAAYRVQDAQRRQIEMLATVEVLPRFGGGGPGWPAGPSAPHSAGEHTGAWLIGSVPGMRRNRGPW